MESLKAGKRYVALVAPGSLDSEHDAMIFGSMAHAVRWVRAQLRANGRPVYGRGYSYRRTDGTLDGDSTLGACWPCFDETFRQGFGVHLVGFDTFDWASEAEPIGWDGFDYVAGAITAGPRGGVVVNWG